MSIVVYYVQTWCISKREPVFRIILPTSPLYDDRPAILSSFCKAASLGQVRFKGRKAKGRSCKMSFWLDYSKSMNFDRTALLVGAILIIIGLYFVLWCKCNDAKFAVGDEMDAKEVFAGKASRFCSTSSGPNNPIAAIKWSSGMQPPSERRHILAKLISIFSNLSWVIGRPPIAK